MVEHASSQQSQRPDETRSTLRELQAETLPLVLPFLCLGGFLLLTVARRFEFQLQADASALILFLLPVAVIRLRKVNYVASVWLLALACVVVNLLVTFRGPFGPAICLLALPVGLVALYITVGAGALVAAACSLLLLLAPGDVFFFDGPLVVAALVGMWGTLGIVWLTRHSLGTAMQWYWSSYEESRRALEQARDTQQRLNQTLEDLAHANLQLTRLHRLAHTLRHAAEEARRTKERFVANVSHELRTPLNMIIGFSEMILQSPEVYGANLPPKLLADLDVILRNSRHLSRLVDDVLDLSQIEVGEMALTRERASLEEIIESAVIAVRPLYDTKGLYLRMKVPRDLPQVFCDRTRIRQVVLNLLSNAGRFTEQGGVQIGAHCEDGYVTVSVADTGPGITATEKDRIFQPFHQLDGSIRRRYGGSGLGLSISKRFIELHGGKIWFESYEGKGTAFHFRLPVDPPTAIEPSLSRLFTPYLEYQERTHPWMAPAPVVRPRFVVLERGEALQRLLTRYLDEAEIVPVSSLQQALDELAQTPARALLVNDMSLTEPLQQLSEVGALPFEAPAIVCSVPGAHEAVGAIGVSDYLVKPISRETLLAALDRIDRPIETLLIADDEPDALRLFRRMVISAERDYRVLTAADGEEALSILREEHPDVVLLDLIMPGKDGFWFLAEKGRDPSLRDTPVIVISARDPEGQPIVSNGLALMRGGELSIRQLLDCVQQISRILSVDGSSAGPVPAAAPAG